MKIKKKQIEEILDRDGNIIGNNSVPQVDSNMDSDAHGTTDQNVGMHSQNFKNDFLGRFGFYYYESDNQGENRFVDKLSKIIPDGDKVKEIISLISSEVESVFEEKGKKLDETEIKEDIITTEKTDKSVVDKKEEDDLKLKKVADLLNKLPKNELDKLMNLLEYKKK